jgi:MFS family permease
MTTAGDDLVGDVRVRAPAVLRDKPMLVVGGAALGTLFEWYDFFLYATLAGYLARHFFAGVSEATAFILALATFAVGPAVRPFGALVFGRLGDVAGRKRTFLATMLIMGLATFLVGLLPGFAAIGGAAPVLLVTLRLLQGLAVGGEYGGAAVYVAEHAPADRRGLHTCWINAAAPAGMIVSLLVVISFRLLLSKAAFEAWGWRLPYLLSILLLAVSLWIRLKLSESPIFAQMKAEATVSKAPLAEAFGRWDNLRPALLALACCAGQGAIGYTAGTYTQFFLQRVLKVEDLSAWGLIAIGGLIGLPAYLFFGWLSDMIGRRPVILAGLALAAATLFPVFHMMTVAANPALAAAQSTAPVRVRADPATCSVQFDPTGANKFDRTGCDIAKAYLSNAGVSYHNVQLAPGAPTEVRVGEQAIRPPDPRGLAAVGRSRAIAAFQQEATTALTSAGYPTAADTARVDAPHVIALVILLGLTFAMVYAPSAAFLVELFPARIRYTALSLPYHLGHGWVGGFMPATAFAIVAATGDVYSGLWYPVSFTVAAAIICTLFLPETRGRSIAG